MPTIVGLIFLTIWISGFLFCISKMIGFNPMNWFRPKIKVKLYSDGWKIRHIYKGKDGELDYSYIEPGFKIGKFHLKDDGTTDYCLALEWKPKPKKIRFLF